MSQRWLITRHAPHLTHPAAWCKVERQRHGTLVGAVDYGMPVMGALNDTGS